jgi:hypothetical protein
MIGVCKFCKCTENSPCSIPLARDRYEGMEGVWFPGGVPPLGQALPCDWLLDDVCTNPACVEAAYLEARPQAEALMQKLAMIFDVEAA